MIFGQQFAREYFDFPLYVDEVSPDNIKAVVSEVWSAQYNIVLIRLKLYGSATARLGGYINGMMVIPVGKYVCINMQSPDPRKASGGMILLDLKGGEEIAERMAAQLKHEALQNKFMEVFEEVARHPEDHGKFKLIVGKPPGYKLWNPGSI